MNHGDSKKQKAQAGVERGGIQWSSAAITATNNDSAVDIGMLLLQQVPLMEIQLLAHGHVEQPVGAHDAGLHVALLSHLGELGP